MACTQTLGGILQDCMPSMGGLREVFVINHAAVKKVTVTDGKISAIELAEDTDKFRKYYVRRQTSQFTSTLNVDQTNGSRFISTDIALVFTRMDTTKRTEMEALSAGELAVIAKDQNGKYWYFGYDNPVMASAGDGQTGTSNTDRNGYSITLQDNSQQWPYEVDESIVDALVE
ncbi:MAG: hypothetical protein NC115_12155 [Bacteroidales bacterium]|nr:hypothetical protein [Bacteroidales bacterium]